LLERYLIEHCAPTLASLKTANLFSLNFSSENNFDKQFNKWNCQLGKKGISLLLLHRYQQTALIYVYRRTRLQDDLRKSGVAAFLAQYGYQSTDIDYALSRLSERFNAGEDFPHEIGLFLDYPLSDVIGFIENEGRNCKLAGCWKVYSDEHAASKLFAKFKKCKDVYSRLWNEGKTVLQLTVAA